MSGPITVNSIDQHQAKFWQTVAQAIFGGTRETVTTKVPAIKSSLNLGGPIVKDKIWFFGSVRKTVTTKVPAVRVGPNLGGPIVKDKIWFFGSTEMTRQ